MRISLPPLLLALMIGCVPPAAPVPVQPAPPRPRPAPPSPESALSMPPPSDWRDARVAPGTWRYTRDSRGSLALFGLPGADATLVFRCDLTDRQIYLSRPGASLVPMTIRTSSISRTVALRPTGGAPPYVALALAPGDPLIDAMGFSRGRFAIDQPGIALFVVPAWAEIGRVAEDCRG